jgi:hypothetical protein
LPSATIITSYLITSTLTNLWNLGMNFMQHSYAIEQLPQVTSAN